MRNVTGVALITGLVLLTGCGSASGLPGRTRSPAPATTGGPASGSPADTDRLVLRAKITGGIAGFGGPGAIPEFSLYGDGRAIVSGNRVGGLERLTEYRLTSTALRRLINDAHAAGLDRPRNVDRPGVADATYLQLTFTAGGTTARTRVIEVGAENDPAERFWKQRLDGPGWPRTDLTSDPAPYRPVRLAVLATETGQGTGAPPVDWPLSTLDRGERVGMQLCTLYTGRQLARATKLLDEAAPDARWRDAGKITIVRPRPLLPDEQNCAALTAN